MISVNKSKPASSYHHENLRDTLIENALILLSSEGIAGVSLRKVAKASGVSHAAPAHHFKDKTGLMAAVAAKGFRILTQDLISAAARSTDAQEQIRQIVWSYVRFAQREVELFRLIFGPSTPDYKRYPELFTAGMDCWALLVKTTESFIEKYGANSQTPELTAFCIWAQAQGVASLIVNQAVIPPEIIPLKSSMLEHSIEFLIAGLLRESVDDH